MPDRFYLLSMCIANQESIDINDSEVSERFSDVKAGLNNLDLIVFLAITKEYLIEYTEGNSVYRKAADECFKKIYRDDIRDLFPKYGHSRIIEILGDRITRIKKLESCLN